MGDPISQYVLKVHSRCDLACDHCYVYEHADQTWRSKPRFISAVTAGMAATRIAQHAAAQRLGGVSVVLHGGEPLLLGMARMRALLDVLTTRIGQVAEADLRIHSNGVLLDEQWCDMFAEYGVRVGVSLDGDRAANDRHRRFPNGESSYPHVLAALSLLRSPRYRRLYAGILCTVDLANDPVAVYRALVAQEPANLDLLLPHATWEHPPDRPAGRQSPYADWLMRVFDCWERDGRAVPIRIFDSLLSASRGGPSLTEAIGTDPADLLVIDTDGTWEQPDSMKTAFHGAAATGMNVFDHAVDVVAGHPAVAARQHGIAALCPTCRACPVARVCGGGLYAHRYRPIRGKAAADDHTSEFHNPSVYCADLKALIEAATAADRRRPRGRLIRSSGSAAGVSGRADEQLPGLPSLVLPEGGLDSLAAGPGDPAAVDVLAALRLSEARSLVATVAESGADWQDTELRDAAAEGWALLCALGREHPRPVQEVFEHPYAYAWALRCLRPPPGADKDLDRAHLAGLAAAAALRAGVAAELPVPVRGGLVHLPTAGAAAVSPADGTTRLVSIAPGRDPALRGGGRWRRARYVTTPPFGRLAVEDLDPFRDCQHWPASDRLSPAEWRSWQRRLTTTGRDLAQGVPRYAMVLGAGLRAVVPLRSPAAGNRSSTARQAFGAVAVALPGPAPGPGPGSGAGTPVGAGHGRVGGDLAELLLHEFQHVKLNALLDLCRLFEPSCRSRLRVPWRQDPRPVEGVLHGLYAYLAVTHLHRSRGQSARASYLRFRSWVADAAAELLGIEDALTPAGRRFVTGLATAAESGGG
jgi:uncharacterized protein